MNIYDPQLEQLKFIQDQMLSTAFVRAHLYSFIVNVRSGTVARYHIDLFKRLAERFWTEETMLLYAFFDYMSGWELTFGSIDEADAIKLGEQIKKAHDEEDWDGQYAITSVRCELYPDPPTTSDSYRVDGWLHGCHADFDCEPECYPFSFGARSR